MSNKSDPKDDTNYFSSLKYGRDEGVAQDVHVDISDAYANYKQYMISFLHVPSNTTVHFKAFVTEYNENYACSWSPTEVYGRTDPIQTYKGTKRSVSLSFDVPASSVGEAYENLGRVSKLVQMLYPTYSPNEIGSGMIIGQAPLIRVKMMNLITNERTAEDPDMDNIYGMLGLQGKLDEKNPISKLRQYRTAPNPDNGVLAAISTISYRSDLQKVQMFEKAPNTVLPQSLGVSLSFDVIHERTMGFDPLGNPLDPSGPHKISMYMPAEENRVKDDQNPRDISNRIREERDNQAREDNRRAAKGKLFGRLGGLGRGASQVGGGGNYSQSDIPLYGKEK